MNQILDTKPTTSELAIVLRQFITAYRSFEKSKLSDGYLLIRHLLKNTSLASHLCDHWRWKKKDFGVFWLNLDYKHQIKFLRYWDLDHSDNERYLIEQAEKEKNMQEADENQKFTLSDAIAASPILPKKFYDVLVFFNNNGICDHEHKGIILPKKPAKNKDYGNARNWGDYFLSLNSEQEDQLLEAILNTVK